VSELRRKIHIILDDFNENRITTNETLDSITSLFARLEQEKAAQDEREHDMQCPVHNGPAVWCIQQRKQMPQRPVEDRIRAGGIWDLDSMGLLPNRREFNGKN